jgi:hypothetical protein
MRTVFADTYFFFAIGNDCDPAHAKAIAFAQNYTGKSMTTGWVLTELADGWSRPPAGGSSSNRSSRICVRIRT